MVGKCSTQSAANSKHETHDSGENARTTTTTTTVTTVKRDRNVETLEKLTLTERYKKTEGTPHQGMGGDRWFGLEQAVKKVIKLKLA